MISPAVRAQVRRDFAWSDRRAARRLVGDLARAMAAYPIGTTDRVERAALHLARGDLGRLEGTVALAWVDWRDVLADAGG